MTVKLYYDHPYLKEWTAEIVEVYEKDDKFHIVLNETAFYPEGGGQPCDYGEINNIRIIDVYEKDDIIYHVAEKELEKGPASCKIDYERRFDMMQQHSGEHLLSGIFFHEYEGQTSSFHLGDDYVSIDILLPEITKEMADNVESLANKVIYENRDIKTYIVSSEEANKYPLRKRPPIKDNLRIVEIDSADYIPCCGTHVKTTGEIGMVKIMKTERYKGVTRVYFKCGNRALSDYRNKHDIISELSKFFSSTEEEIIERAESYGNQIKALAKDVNDLKDKIFKYEADEIIKSTNGNVISICFDDKNFDDIQMLSKQILNGGDYIIILSSSIDNRLLFAKSGDFDIACGKIFKEHINKYNGRGGGNEKQAQAGFQSLEELQAFQSFLVETCN